MKKAAAREALINYLKNPDPDAVVTLKDGVKWVAHLQPFYWELLGVSHQTLRNIISEPPFVRKPKILGATIVKDGDNTKVHGGKKFCLLRVLADGEAPPQRDYADEAKRVMIKIWTTSDVVDEKNKKLNKKPISCLWGMAGNIIELVDDRPAEQGMALAIAVFKHAVAHWIDVVPALKLEAEKKPHYEPRYFDKPSITYLRGQWRAAVYAYIQAVQMGDAKLPAGVELTPQASMTLLTLTDPLVGHPGLTAKINKALDGGYAAAEKKMIGHTMTFAGTDKNLANQNMSH
jgi:hypothetical protein